MTEYDIAGKKVVITTQVENELYVKRGTSSYINSIESTFYSWYSSCLDCEEVVENANYITEKTLNPLIDQCVKMVTDQGVYTISRSSFLSTYCQGILDEFYDVIDIVIDSLEKIDRQEQSERHYRELRKATRGRVVGGGFGLSGALKGMAKAGVINAATGTAHSIGNAFGNMGSSISASSSKHSIYKNAKEPLRKALVNSAYGIRNGLREALWREARIQCKYVTITENNKATAIIQNYKSGRIPLNVKKDQLIEALLLDPFRNEIYHILWDEYGDKYGDLVDMSNKFGCDLESKIRKLVENYGNRVFAENCSEYDEAFDKIKCAIQIEEKINKTIESILVYCDEKGINETPSVLDKCYKILANVDIAERTVNDVIYNTREIASNVRNDYSLMYETIFNRDLNKQEVFDDLKKINFISEEFNINLEDIYSNEKNLRDPKKIFDNISIYIDKFINKYTSYANSFHIPKVVGEYEKNESKIISLVNIESSEVPLAYLDCTGKVKSGLLFTNRNLHIISKGLFSSEKRKYLIDNISSIECIGLERYVLHIGEEVIEFNLKQKNDVAEGHISLGKLINDFIKLIQNIRVEERENLYRILNSVRTCICGYLLLENEKICPNCKRIIKNNGEIVDSKVCPKCGKYSEISKKFCAKCGYSFEKKIVDSDSSIENNDEVNNKNEVENYIVCKNCGSKVKITNEKKFCSQCGANLINQDLKDVANNQNNENNICPKCGNKIKKGKKFCSQCGYKL